MKRYYYLRTSAFYAETFQEFVADALASGTANVRDGKPWSFTWFGAAVTNERDDLYLISCPDRNGGSTTLQFTPNDMLVKDCRTGLVCVIPVKDFVVEFIAEDAIRNESGAS